ncbi:thioredoxin family protein [Pseudorhodobacter sp. W20_MBD10_FR17]|uniref:thioredoxin family protein n=1 Tax=Pseudorhodobacter sp. W20_MBD10_FR17 TaxID=3240266 RepID=UPI003F95406B
MLVAAKAIRSLFRHCAFALGLWLATSVFAVTQAAAQEVTLYMVEQPGCIYCARWNAEVGDAYEKTAEGRAAPLKRIQLRDPLPDGVSFERKAVFTPTFILVQNGQELERIEGYPGEDFFYGMLGVMLKNAGITLE